MVVILVCEYQYVDVCVCAASRKRRNVKLFTSQPDKKVPRRVQVCIDEYL